MRDASPNRLYMVTDELLERGWTHKLIDDHLQKYRFAKREATGTGYYFVYQRGGVGQQAKLAKIRDALSANLTARHAS